MELDGEPLCRKCFERCPREVKDMVAARDLARVKELEDEKKKTKEEEKSRKSLEKLAIQDAKKREKEQKKEKMSRWGILH